jgi:hypothetical protein
LALAEVAFSHNFVFFIHFQSPIRTNHNASPAAHAFVFVVADFTCGGVFGHGTGEACGDARCVFAVATLYSERDGFADFPSDSAYSFGVFFIVSFHYVFCFRVRYGAVDFA